MGGHQSSARQSDDWLTPPGILEALGPFDLDPCAPIERPWDTAAEHYTIADNGLAKRWRGRVWLNPPYGREAARWLRRLAEHGNGTALIFARTETTAFHQYVWPLADGVLFVRGRLHFHHPDGTRASGNGGAPSALVAYGRGNLSVLQASEIPGHVVVLAGGPGRTSGPRSACPLATGPPDRTVSDDVRARHAVQ
jgi:hypothetical protein